MGTYRTTSNGFVQGRISGTHADITVNGVRIYSTWSQR
jgi:hypothetical protein